MGIRQLRFRVLFACVVWRPVVSWVTSSSIKRNKSCFASYLKNRDSLLVTLGYMLWGVTCSYVPNRSEIRYAHTGSEHPMLHDPPEGELAITSKPPWAHSYFFSRLPVPFWCHV